MKPPEPALLRRSGTEVELRFDLPPEAEVFAGHYPGYPVMPGVVQLDWSMQMAALHLGLAQPVARDFRVKFTAPITPSDDVRLLLRLADGALEFEYWLGDAPASSGRIILRETP